MIWKCTKCGREVNCPKKPSERWEPVITVQVGKQSYEGRDNPNPYSSANHYGPVCFGGERGEDYYEHNWGKRIKEQAQ